MKLIQALCAILCLLGSVKGGPLSGKSAEEARGVVLLDSRTIEVLLPNSEYCALVGVYDKKAISRGDVQQVSRENYLQFARDSVSTSHRILFAQVLVNGECSYLRLDVTLAGAENKGIVSKFNISALPAYLLFAAGETRPVEMRPPALLTRGALDYFLYETAGVKFEHNAPLRDATTAKLVKAFYSASTSAARLRVLDELDHLQKHDSLFLDDEKSQHVMYLLQVMRALMSGSAVDVLAAELESIEKQEALSAQEKQVRLFVVKGFKGMRDVKGDDSL